MRKELIIRTAAELEVDNFRPTDFPEPRRVYPWARYPFKAIRVQAPAIAYTRTAVKIGFFLQPLIKIHHEGWVWLSAATPAPNYDENNGGHRTRLEVSRASGGGSSQ